MNDLRLLTNTVNILVNSHQLSIFEFSEMSFINRNLDEISILEIFIRSKVFNPREDLSRYSWWLNRPFNTKMLKLQRYKKLKNKIDYNNVLTSFVEENDWEDILEDIINIKEISMKYIRKITDMKKWIWYLNKDSISKEIKDKEIDHKELSMSHRFYSYWLSFIEIDKINKRIITIDFSYE